MRRASGTTRGSAERTPSTSVKMEAAGARRRMASATAVVSLPPRPSVVTSLSRETPWKPATITTRPRSSSAWIRSPRSSRMRASLWRLSVMMPLWEPVKEMAGQPIDSRHMASKVIEIRSPAVRSISNSRREGARATRWARRINSSVCWPMAETTTTMGSPEARRARTRRATAMMWAGLSTEVPPNFRT